MVTESTALVIYKTTPHIDQRQRGLQASELMMRILRDEVTPTQALAKPPMLLNILYHNTNVPPMEPILTAAKQLETRPDVLVANVAVGYPYADVHEIGPSFVVVTDDNPQLAQTEADRLSDMLWNVHGQLTLDLPDAAQAVAQAIASEQHPVILCSRWGTISAVVHRGIALSFWRSCNDKGHRGSSLCSMIPRLCKVAFRRVSVQMSL